MTRLGIVNRWDGMGGRERDGSLAMDGLLLTSVVVQDSSFLWCAIATCWSDCTNAENGTAYKYKIEEDYNEDCKYTTLYRGPLLVNIV